MNLLDVVILAIFIISTMLGVYKGFLKLSIHLLYFAASFILTFFLFPLLHNIISEHVSEQLYANILSGFLSYLISIILCSFLNRRTVKLVQSISGGFIDKLLGMVVGASRGGLICLTIYSSLIIVTTGSYLGSVNRDELKEKITLDKMPKWITESQIFPNLYEVLVSSVDLIPEERVTYILKKINSQSSYRDKIQETMNSYREKQSNITIEQDPQKKKTHDELEDKLNQIITSS